MGVFSTFRRWYNGISRFDQLYKENYMVGQQGPAWLPTDDPYKLYELVPQLKIVIDRRADMFSNAEVILTDLEGNRIEGKEGREFTDFFNRPAPEYSLNEWLANYDRQLSIFGNQYMYAPFVSGLQPLPSFLRNLPPDAVQPYMSGKFFDQKTIEGIIPYYLYCDTSYGTGERQIKAEDMIHSKIADVRFPALGRSPILSLKLPASNTDAAYTNLNVISNNRGALGILSSEASKDGMGGNKTIKPEEAKEIRKDIQQTHNKKRILGRHEVDVVVTSASLKWQAMSFPTRELLLLEQITDNGLVFCHAFGVSQNILFGENATYENVHKGLVMTYQNTTQPAADSLAQSLTDKIYRKRGKMDRLIKLSYEHVPALKIEKKSAITSVESLVNALTASIEAGVISVSDAKIILRNELIAIGSIDR